MVFFKSEKDFWCKSSTLWTNFLLRTQKSHYFCYIVSLVKLVVIYRSIFGGQLVAFFRLAAASSPVVLGWVTVWTRDQKVDFNWKKHFCFFFITCLYFELFHTIYNHMKLLEQLHVLVFTLNRTNLA